MPNPTTLACAHPTSLKKAYQPWPAHTQLLHISILTLACAHPAHENRHLISGLLAPSSLTPASQRNLVCMRAAPEHRQHLRARNRPHRTDTLGGQRSVCHQLNDKSLCDLWAGQVCHPLWSANAWSM